MLNMVRQCAWCLHLINNAGERLSLSPLPKMYNASHGICDICGSQWIEQALEGQETLDVLTLPENDPVHENNPQSIETRDSLRILATLQQGVSGDAVPWPEREGSSPFSPLFSPRRRRAHR